MISKELTFWDSKLLSLADDDRLRLSAEPVEVITLDGREAGTGDFCDAAAAMSEAVLRGISVTFAALVVEVPLLSAASELRLTRWLRICWAVEEAAAFGAGLSVGSSSAMSSCPIPPFSSLITTMSPFSTSSELWPT